MAEAGIAKKMIAAAAGMTVSSIYQVIEKGKDRGYDQGWVFCYENGVRRRYDEVEVNEEEVDEVEADEVGGW